MNRRDVAARTDDGEWATVYHKAFTFEDLPKSAFRSDETANYKRATTVASTGVVQRDDHNEILTLTTGWYISARIRYVDIIDIV